MKKENLTSGEWTDGRIMNEGLCYWVHKVESTLISADSTL